VITGVQPRVLASRASPSTASPRPRECPGPGVPPTPAPRRDHPTPRRLRRPPGNPALRRTRHHRLTAPATADLPQRDHPAADREPGTTRPARPTPRRHPSRSSHHRPSAGMRHMSREQLSLTVSRQAESPSPRPTPARSSGTRLGTDGDCFAPGCARHDDHRMRHIDADISSCGFDEINFPAGLFEGVLRRQ
jgi:hypothetical protein